MSKVLTLVFFSLIFSISPQARRPAVEPVRGLSIDHIDSQAPIKGKIKGYNFQQKTNHLATPDPSFLDQRRSITSNPEHAQHDGQISLSQKKAFFTPSPTLLILFAFSLPMIAIGLLAIRIRQSQEAGEKGPDNLHSLERQREKSEQDLADDHNNDDISKAS